MKNDPDFEKGSRIWRTERYFLTKNCEESPPLIPQLRKRPRINLLLTGVRSWLWLAFLCFNYPHSKPNPFFILFYREFRELLVGTVSSNEGISLTLGNFLIIDWKWIPKVRFSTPNQNLKFSEGVITPLRAIFNLVSKVIRDLIGFTFTLWFVVKKTRATLSTN